MKTSFPKLSATVLFVALCAVSTGASAQDAKKAMATKLAQMQAKSDGAALANQLTADAVQLPLSAWSQRLDESVPPARQKDVRDKLDVELKKFADNTHKAIEAQVSKAAETALVPLFMDKLSEDEMKTVIAYMESPAAVKFQSLSGDAGNAWAQKVIDATRSTVEANVKSFDAAATKIVGVPATPPAGAPANGAASGSKK
ncbi:MAG: hypothetical protein J0I00_11520 [Burkholderiales bacterium]|uniref:DUF2059 domain-containing protein n=1 Tax=Ottowia pentelensis TaxID=511108 RepID=A0ABV6PQL3_9BURK|nr:hypothetical protein [Ottowia sp.]MBN9406033.1 hypothetical protein [Burkholderiales bacterium]MBS0403514.1 hypothetical protein [Pseudomonadota bacterium]MBS0415820.1 hypothetical protein [Pseudomonadota bacterium]